MNNNNDFTSNTFTWALDENTQQSTTKQPPPTQQQQPDAFGLSDADLFQFLLGEEAQRAVVTSEHNYPTTKTEGGSSVSDEGPSMEEYVKKQKSYPPNTQPSTSRLDFRPINDYIPESQLKSMTSKERRQLRNKISARNFRNRRKEYIGTLEDELNQQKAENSQLKLELKWVKAKMEKLQKENDKLRVDLVLGGIVLPAQGQQQQQQPQLSPYMFDSSMMQPTLNMANSNSSSSDESNLSSPPNLLVDFPDNWDFILPQEQQPQNTYLSHATVPNWNIDQVLSKETSLVPTNNHLQLFQQYPLLAPALMSIVLTHTMTMSTNELLATAKLDPPPPNAMIPFKNQDLTTMTNKEAQAVWNILEPLTLLNNRNAKISADIIKVQDDENKKSAKTSKCTDAYNKLVLPYCPVTWLQQRVCKYLCEYAANHCKPKPVEKKYGFCKHLEKAKRYINPCN